MPLVRTSLLGKHGPSGTASRGRKAHRVPGRRRTDTSRKIPVRPPQRCHLAVRATSTVGLASGPPGGRRAASTLDRATPTVCHMGQAPGQSSRRQYPGSDAGQTDGVVGGAGMGAAERACVGQHTYRRPVRTAGTPSDAPPYGRQLRPVPARSASARTTCPAPASPPPPPAAPRTGAPASSAPGTRRARRPPAAGRPSCPATG